MARSGDQFPLFPQELGDELVGTVSRVTFRSEATGYTVLRVSPEGEEKTLAVVGRMPPLAVGERIRARVRHHFASHAKAKIPARTIQLGRSASAKPSGSRRTAPRCASVHSRACHVSSSGQTGHSQAGRE